MSDQLSLFYEPEDVYVLCVQCRKKVYDYCPVHGPPMVVEDTKVEESGLLGGLPAAAYTLPESWLHFARSSIPGAGVGVFSYTAIPPNVRFGPYRGVLTQEVTSTYCWEVSYSSGPGYIVDGQDENNSNWMRYVNITRHLGKQNLLAYQYRGQIYYKSIKLIEPNTELLVSCEFVTLLGIELSEYSSAYCYENDIALCQLTRRDNVAYIIDDVAGAAATDRACVTAKCDECDGELFEYKPKDDEAWKAWSGQGGSEEGCRSPDARTWSCSVLKVFRRGYVQHWTYYEKRLTYTRVETRVV